jgi:hypothetical protein
MTPATADRLRRLLAPFDRVHFYVADPGAVALMQAAAAATAQPGDWFADGWAAANLTRSHRPAAALPAALAAAETPATALVLGSQTTYARTRRVLADCRAHGVAGVFLFDHWKNFAAHFVPDDGGPAVLPDHIGVPDDAALTLLQADFARHGLPATAAATAVVVGHPALEASAARILGFSAAENQARRAALAADGQPLVLLLLDPAERGGPDDPGYGWESVMDFLAARAGDWRPGARIIVKPHPRQAPERVAAALARWRAAGGDVAPATTGDVEALIAVADEVWGVTTVALVAALQAGKPVRSFQINRNAAGVRASNPHIEPFVITG